MAMRDEFELSGSQFFSPCSPTEAEVMQLLQACAPAGQAQTAEDQPPGSTAVCSGGRGDMHQPPSSSRGPDGPEADTVVSLEASMCGAAGHLQPAASSGEDREADGWAGEAGCACSGRQGAARANCAPLAASEPDQAPGLTASPGSAPPGSAAARAQGWPGTPGLADAAGEASDDLPRAAAAGMDRSPEGAGAAGLSTEQSLSEAAASGALQQGLQDGRGLGRVEDKPAAGADGGGGRPHAALRWAEAGYLPVNPLVRTAVGVLAHGICSRCALACMCAATPRSQRVGAAITVL